MDYFHGLTEENAGLGNVKDDWTVTDMTRSETAPPSANVNTDTTPATESQAAEEDEEDEIPDLNDLDFEEEIEEEADTAAATPPAALSNAKTPASSSNTSMRMRTYDISIVYDKYYRTPCVFLIGKDEFGAPLSLNQIWEDVSSEHSNKTITQGDHPHTGLAHLYIHPCKHASTMKNMLTMLEEEQRDRIEAQQTVKLQEYEAAMTKYKSDMEVYQDASKLTKPVKPAFSEDQTKKLVRESLEKAMPVDQYMLLFLKFINTVIPTVEYDFTMSSM